MLDSPLHFCLLGQTNAPPIYRQGTMHTEQLKKIIGQFKVSGTVKRILPFGSGHINDTYKVDLINPEGHFVLQKINHHVFPDVNVLMNNLILVTQHMVQRNEVHRQLGKPCFPFNLHFISTKSDHYYYVDEENEYWRFMPYVPDSRSYDQVKTVKQALEGGHAFGKFHALLEGLDAQSIQEVIPNFHHIGHRLDQLDEAVQSNPLQRLTEVNSELLFIRDRSAGMMRVLQKAEQGLIKKRILHNDTKFNNILFDKEGKALCVIDLDTVMPGYLAYDFGDAIRSIINTCAEDEADLDRIGLNIPLFEAYAEGYFKEMVSYLNDEEVDALMDGVLLLPYMQAVRFLTDFLLGDNYFKVQHPHHNLQRTRAQLKLVRELESAEHELRSILEDKKNLFRHG